jgi:hypothetical protein
MGGSDSVYKAGKADVAAQIDNTEFEDRKLKPFTMIFYTLAKDSE